ncbi:MAG: carbon storage regulator CsrA [Nitrospirota bacterium]|jgi:carbon storage regulator
MLVLTRKLGEGITIGSDIRVVVLEVKAGQVRLGIQAPPTVQIHRDEIYAKIVEENRKAAAIREVPAEALKQLRRPSP